jgi:hypothetical protein
MRPGKSSGRRSFRTSRRRWSGETDRPRCLTAADPITGVTRRSGNFHTTRYGTTRCTWKARTSPPGQVSQANGRKSGQTSQRVHIRLLHRRRQIPDRHVLDHAAAKGLISVLGDLPSRVGEPPNPGRPETQLGAKPYADPALAVNFIPLRVRLIGTWYYYAPRPPARALAPPSSP